ncbi:MAG: Tim44 domain-containing protein [Syntrophales bacterium]
MFADKWVKRGILLFTLTFFFFYMMEIDALARVGGGRSYGSRGSRSLSAPKPSPSNPARPFPSGQYSQPASTPVSQPPQMQGGGFWRSMAGGVLGGMIGGMLFRGLGFAGGGYGMGGGIGLLDIILIAALLYGVYWFIKRRRQAAASGAYYSEAGAVDAVQPSFSHAPAYEQSSEDDRDRGIGHIRQMDPSFDEKKFQDACMDYFFKIQGAWAGRDMRAARDILTDEMYGAIQADADRLKAEKRINKLDNIAVRTVEITEAWQEEGKDFITVRFYANLLDYTIDEVTGSVVSGSSTEPVKFEEYWTFTRPVGSNPWKLSAINQAQ